MSMSPPPIVIPLEPCWWEDPLYFGKEVEYTLIGAARPLRNQFARHFVGQLARRMPSSRRSSDTEQDVFVAHLGRVYVEMREFVEFGLATCFSGEAVAWVSEEALKALAGIHAQADGRPVVLAHTPSDYNGSEAKSTGCHFNVQSPQTLSEEQVESLAGLTSPLNCVCGPGGVEFLGAVPQLSCDPRAKFIRRLYGSRAHGESEKPFLMYRPEFSEDLRYQYAAFGNPRSPISSWLQAELLAIAFRAVLARVDFPWWPESPIHTLRAGPDAKIGVRRGKHGRTRTSRRKEDVAKDTIEWLMDFAHQCVEGRSSSRVELLRDLSLKALAANTTQGEPPVFPTDIAIKRALFDVIARRHGFKDFRDLGEACGRARQPNAAKTALDETLVTDVLFSSPQVPIYERAAEAGLFVRPQFEEREERNGLSDGLQLPAGIAPRDRLRAELLKKGEIALCDWQRLKLTDGSTVHLPNPWSCASSSQPATASNVRSRQANLDIEFADVPF